MAGIDKIYLTRDQCFDFTQWIYKKTFLIILFTWRNPCRYLYEIPIEAFDKGNELKEYPATNFHQAIDKFLFVFCRFPYIQKRLKEQYGSLWSCWRPYWVYVMGVKISNLISKNR